MLTDELSVLRLLFVVLSPVDKLPMPLKEVLRPEDVEVERLLRLLLVVLRPVDRLLMPLVAVLKPVEVDVDKLSM
ncbi:hypothetical protein, partial [Variovorax sp. CF313]|uniref:hypothetical protein n=1 Tax=Variovorax sp. CF313 TaxID=1144315 RepID=UPI0005B28FC0